jgi:hypothetical protein
MLDYAERTRDTTRLWAEHPGIGTIKAPKFHPTKLALTTGDFVASEIGEILDGLGNLVGHDDLADVASKAAFHFSFLSISLPLFDSLEEISELDALRACFDECCAGHTFTVKKLRLVALPDSLLLAGIPDDDSSDRRAYFAKRLLHTSWNGTLEKRYPGGTIPPAFWHSTLIRYNAECLPERFRKFFKDNQDRGFGEITLPIRLFAANYSWKTSFALR